MNEAVYYNLRDTIVVTPILSVQISREIGRLIVFGLINAEEELDDVSTLAIRYQVSQLVIREALKILINKGMLKISRGARAVVKARSEWSLLDDDILAWHLNIPIEKYSGYLIPLMESRLCFEGKAAFWAAERANKDDLKRIEKAYQEIYECGADFSYKVIAKFYGAITKAARNEFLHEMEGVSLAGIILSSQILGTELVSTLMYKEIYVAICQKDAIRAQKLSEQLINEVIQLLSESLIESIA